MSSSNRSLVSGLKGILAGLRSSYLAMFMAALFAADLFFPDPLPFLDEMVLFVVTILLARWKGQNQEPDDPPKPPPKDVTPASDASDPAPPGD